MIFNALRVFTHYFFAVLAAMTADFPPEGQFSVRPKKISVLSMSKDWLNAAFASSDTSPKEFVQQAVVFRQLIRVLFHPFPHSPLFQIGGFRVILAVPLSFHKVVCEILIDLPYQCFRIFQSCHFGVIDGICGGHAEQNIPELFRIDYIEQLGLVNVVPPFPN